MQRVFPALDLLRFVWLHPQGSDFLLRPQLLNIPQSNVPQLVLTLLKQANAEPFVKITALRNFVNLFVLPNAREHVLRLTEQLLDILPDLVKDQNKLVRFAAVTLLLKYVLRLSRRNTALTNFAQLLSTLARQTES